MRINFSIIDSYVLRISTTELNSSSVPQDHLLIALKLCWK